MTAWSDPNIGSRTLGKSAHPFIEVVCDLSKQMGTTFSGRTSRIIPPVPLRTGASAVSLEQTRTSSKVGNGRGLAQRSMGGKPMFNCDLNDPGMRCSYLADSRYLARLRPIALRLTQWEPATVLGIG
jgi:hypothetical protein